MGGERAFSVVDCDGHIVEAIPELARRVGIEAFAWASDYPHEVDLAAAKHMIEETIRDVPLTDAEKAALLGGNARRFFRLPARSRPAQVAGVKG
jgi:predicted TIM-barrel fold metal-dependent hydrolase